MLYESSLGFVSIQRCTVPQASAPKARGIARFVRTEFLYPRSICFSSLSSHPAPEIGDSIRTGDDSSDPVIYKKSNDKLLYIVADQSVMCGAASSPLFTRADVPEGSPKPGVISPLIFRQGQVYDLGDRLLESICTGHKILVNPQARRWLSLL